MTRLAPGSGSGPCSCGTGAPCGRGVSPKFTTYRLEPVPDRRVSPQRAVKGDKPTDEEGLVMACGRRAA
jgi:hypothetical protein